MLFRSEAKKQGIDVSGAPAQDDVSSLSDADLIAEAQKHGIDVPDQQPGFMDRVSQDMGEREHQALNIAARTLQHPAQTPLSALQLFGKVGVGGGFDIAGEAAKSVIPDFVKNTFSSGAQGIANAIDSTGAGKFAGDTALQALTGYQDFAKANPAISDTIDAMANVAGLGLGGKAVGVAADAAPAIADAGAAVKAAITPAKEAIPESLTKTDAGLPLSIPPKAMSNAEGVLAQALKDEGINPADVADKLEESQKSGRGLTALDAATLEPGTGRNLMGLAGAAINRPGEGAKMAGQLALRGADSAPRIGDLFDKNISGSKYYNTQADAIQAMEGAGPKYDEAYAKNQNIQSPEIDRILKTPAGQSALKTASVKMQNDMSFMGVNDPELMEQAKLTGQYVPGSGGVASGLKLRSLDYVKRALDDQIGTAQRAGENDNVRILTGLKNNLVKALDKADVTATAKTPGAYAQGRQTYATAARMQESLEKGRSFMSMDKEEISDFMKDKNIPDPQKKAFAVGVRRAIQDTIDRGRDGTNPITKINNRALKDRLAPLFNDSADAQKFFQSLTDEQHMHNVNGILGGSPTAPRLEYGKMLEGQPGNVGKALKMIISPFGAAKDAGIDAFSAQLQKLAKNMSSDTSAGVVRYLTTKDPAAWRALAKKINPKKP